MLADLGDEQGWRRPLAVSFGFVFIALFVLASGLGIPLGLAIFGLLALPTLPHLKQLVPLEYPLAIFLVFIAWAWASASWSPYVHSQQAWKMALGAPLYGLFGYAVWTLRGRGRLLALYAALASMLLILAIYAIEAITGFASHLFAEGAEREQMLRDMTRGISAMICATPAAWAFLAMLIPGWRGVMAGVLYGVLAFVIAWHFGLEAGMLAIVVAAMVFGIAWIYPRSTILATGLAAVVLFLLTPMLMPFFLSLLDVDSLPLSWAIRVENWEFAIERIIDKPLFGWGLDASRSFTEPYQIRGNVLPNISVHPHNVGLQLWLETGLIGALLFAASALALAMRVSSAWNLSRSQGAAIAACVGAYLTFCTLTYGAWQEWFWGCAAWIGALCILVGPAPERVTQK
ncbi:MAG: hypothetical protein COA47_08465 [Robiginitomaculum sp.]|nr:MAG: hypothetical protein COA47_08465 [Robiginitomaculum sp.]